jgi:hypothetical protein
MVLAVRERIVQRFISVAIIFMVLLAGCSGSRKPNTEGQTSQRAQQEDRIDKWVQITSTEGHFTAWFPNQPTHTIPSGTVVHQYVAGTKKGTTAFLLRFTPQADTKISLDERLAATRKAMNSTNVEIVPITISGHAGKEMSHEYVDDGVIHLSRQRICYANGNMYQFIVGAQKAKGFPEEDALRFYSGFQLVTP